MIEEHSEQDSNQIDVLKKWEAFCLLSLPVFDVPYIDIPRCGLHTDEVFADTKSAGARDYGYDCKVVNK